MTDEHNTTPEDETVDLERLRAASSARRNGTTTPTHDMAAYARELFHPTRNGAGKSNDHRSGSRHHHPTRI